MIELLWPWVFAFILLPPLFWWLLPPAQRHASAALRVPFYAELEKLNGQAQGGAHGRGQAALAVLAALIYLLLLLSAARPQWLGAPIEIPVSGRDLMLAVDISGSMQETDLRVGGQSVDRLSVVKAVLDEFIQRREGDRLGLILFGEQAYLQTPLTFDRKTVAAMLDEAFIGLAGERATAIGDAMGLAVKRLRERPADNRVLILLTDGVSNAGALRPDKAAELAAQAQVKIYTVGVGASQMQKRGFFGTQTINPSRDLDEKTLQAVAQKTGGRYFRARNTQELEQIYQLLNELEPVEVEAEVFRPITPLYPWSLGAALLLSLLLAGWLSWRHR